MDEFVVDLAELADAPRPRRDIGGKAHHLSRLMAAGLPVPPGIVVTANAASLDDDALAEMFAAARHRLTPLGEVFAVRSSAAMEDRVAAAAPGVFASLLNVRLPVWQQAVGRVWASAQTDIVREYARVHGIQDLGVAVIVQAQVPASPSHAMAAGTLYTRAPGRIDDDELVVEIRLRGDVAPGGQRETIRVTGARGPGADSIAAAVAQISSGALSSLSAEDLARLIRLALDAERVIDAEHGADVEWVIDEGSIWIVQARPVVHPSPRQERGLPALLLAFSRLEPERVWRWDVTHNPEPLSSAQCGLVERMDEAQLAPFRMRVVGGYLYTSSGEQSVELPPPSLASLRRLYEDDVRPVMEACLSAGERSGEPPDLAEALAIYEQFYQLYAARLTPQVGQGKRALSVFLRERVPPQVIIELAGRTAGDVAGRVADGVAGCIDRVAELLIAQTEPVDGEPHGIERALTRAATGARSVDELIQDIGAMAPAWDVACPTFAENRALLDRAVDARRGHTPERDTLPNTGPRAAFDPLFRSLCEHLSDERSVQLADCIAVSRYAHRLGEADDVLFARAQAQVRYALLRVARGWGLAPEDDIFHVPLPTVLACIEHGHAPDLTAVHKLARAGRAALVRQAAWEPPLAFQSGARIIQRGRIADAESWAGRGFGACVRGRAIRVEHTREPPDKVDGAIVVAMTLTPAMAVWVRGAAAIVAEHGGLLDHGAAMARELGIPCVVGCVGAWSAIREQDLLWLDGDAGLVIRTGSSAVLSPPQS